MADRLRSRKERVNTEATSSHKNRHLESPGDDSTWDDSIVLTGTTGDDMSRSRVCDHDGIDRSLSLCPTCAMVSRIGVNSWPRSVKEYSTVGGEVGMT